MQTLYSRHIRYDRYKIYIKQLARIISWRKKNSSRIKHIILCEFSRGLCSVWSKGDFLFMIIKYFQYATFLHRQETS